MKNNHPSKWGRQCYARPMIAFWLYSLAFTTTWAGPVDTLLPGQWYEVASSNLSGVDPCPAHNCSYSGVEGQAAVMNDWAGGAYDSVRDRLIVWGGGHAGYAGNEIYVFDINTLKWTRATEPSAITGSDYAPPNTTSYYGDGKPSSRHTYNYLEYAPNVDLFFSMAGGGTYGPSGNFSADVDSFSFATGAWRSTWPKNPGGGGIGAISAYDPVTKTIWYHGSALATLGQFDPTANSGKGSWVNYSGSQIYLEIYASAAIDSKRRKMVSIGGYGKRQMYVWDLNNPNAPPLIPSTGGDAGGQALESGQAPGFVYDPMSDRFVAWYGGTAVYTLDPVTWVWTKVNAAASNGVAAGKLAANSRGTYGRFRYIPSKNAFIVVNNTTENVFFYKLTSGVGQTPTLTLNATPATTVGYQGSITFTWSSTDTTSCTASGAWNGLKAVSNTETLNNLTASGTYTLSCSGAGGSAVKNVAVTVTGVPLPAVSLQALPTTVNYAGSTTLTWASSNVDSCLPTGAWAGTKATAGKEVIANIVQDSIFKLSCTGGGGTVVAFATVQVLDQGSPNPGATPGTGAGSSTTQAVGGGIVSLFELIALFCLGVPLSRRTYT